MTKATKEALVIFGLAVILDFAGAHLVLNSNAVAASGLAMTVVAMHAIVLLPKSGYGKAWYDWALATVLVAALIVFCLAITQIPHWSAE